jgi:hypothetical protein
MARIRSIKPEFPQSESMGRVSRDARLLFVLLWTICDDSGRTRAASRMLASLLFPYDDDAAGLIDGWLTELEHEGCIVRYTVDGSTYLEIRKWCKHQKIDKPSPSRLPDPREDSREVAKVREGSSEDLGSRTVGSVSGNGSAAAAPPSREQQPPPPPGPMDQAFQAVEQANPPPRRPIPPASFADWRIMVGKRCFVGNDERAEWLAMFQAEGWEEMTEAYQRLTKKHPEPAKIFLSMFQEIRE